MSAAQKFDSTAPCPICAGCAGWMNEDWVNCASELFSGGLETVAWKGRQLYPHRLTGRCGCGEVHGLRNKNGAESRIPAPVPLVSPVRLPVDEAERQGSSGPAGAEEGNTLAAAFARPSSISRFRATPKPREWVVRDLIPYGPTGLIVASGGTGKGHLIQQLGIACATGYSFGSYAVPKRRGVLYLSLEDDEAELHQRVEAAKRAFWTSGRVPEEELVALETYFHQLDLVGWGARLGDELAECVRKKVLEIPDCALVVIDPLTLALPDMGHHTLNSQEGASRVHAAARIIQRVAGVGVLLVHHTGKQSERAGQQMDATAATGSKQLVDLSRYVINLRALEEDDIAQRGLDAFGEYVEVGTSKLNSGPRADTTVWQRCAEGGLRYIPTRRMRDLDADRALDALREIQPATRAAWEKACKEADLPQGRAKAARAALTTSGRVRRTRGERGRGSATKDLFEIAENGS